jgi:glutamine synthetase
MPKPIFGDNGSGMHVHQSIWKDGKPLFAGDKYADLSRTCLYYIGGIIKHAKALNAFTNPLDQLLQAPGPGLRSAGAARLFGPQPLGLVPHSVRPSPKAKRVEVRFPDPMANPYLASPALLMAGLDGIKNKIHPGGRWTRTSTTCRRKS